MTLQDKAQNTTRAVHVVEALQRAVNAKSKAEVLRQYQLAERVEWEFVQDALFEEYNKLVDKGNDIIYY